jgi:hypothetical protein
VLESVLRASAMKVLSDYSVMVVAKGKKA